MWGFLSSWAVRSADHGDGAGVASNVERALALEPCRIQNLHNPTRFGFVYDSPYQSTLDAVYVYVVPWSKFPIVPPYPHICSAMVGVPGRIQHLKPRCLVFLATKLIELNCTLAYDTAAVSDSAWFEGKNLTRASVSGSPAWFEPRTIPH